MDTDLFLVVGLVLGALSVPSFLNGYAESRLPRFALLTLGLGAALVVGANLGNPAGYSVQEVPDVVIRVVGRLIN